MTFDKAHVGDKVMYAERTFGLRPAIPWSEPVTVTDIRTDYYGQHITLSDGTEVSSDLYSMSVIAKAKPFQEEVEFGAW